MDVNNATQVYAAENTLKLPAAPMAILAVGIIIVVQEELFVVEAPRFAVLI